VPFSVTMSFTLPFPCVNCEGPIPWDRRKKIYCSRFCKEQAKDIRWIKSTITRGVYSKPDIVVARHIRIAHLNSGGYLALGRTIPWQTRSLVEEKYNDKCAICGDDNDLGEHEIDHITGSSNSLENLQLLCKPCHLEKTQENIVTVQEDDPRYDEIVIKVEILRKRVESPLPLRLCDDPENWSATERKMSTERKTQYFLHLHQFINQYLDEGISKNKLIEEMNNALIPTYSGHGKWNKQNTRDMLKSINSCSR